MLVNAHRVYTSVGASIGLSYEDVNHQELGRWYPAYVYVTGEGVGYAPPPPVFESVESELGIVAVELSCPEQVDSFQLSYSTTSVIDTSNLITNGNGMFSVPTSVQLCFWARTIRDGLYSTWTAYTGTAGGEEWETVGYDDIITMGHWGTYDVEYVTENPGVWKIVNTPRSDPALVTELYLQGYGANAEDQLTIGAYKTASARMFTEHGGRFTTTMHPITGKRGFGFVFKATEGIISDFASATYYAIGFRRVAGTPDEFYFDLFKCAAEVFTLVDSSGDMASYWGTSASYKEVMVELIDDTFNCYIEDELVWTITDTDYPASSTRIYNGIFSDSGAYTGAIYPTDQVHVSVLMEKRNNTEPLPVDPTTPIDPILDDPDNPDPDPIIVGPHFTFATHNTTSDTIQLSLNDDRTPIINIFENDGETPVSTLYLPTGTGTANSFPVWTSASVLGNATVLTQSGNKVVATAAAASPPGFRVVATSGKTAELLVGGAGAHLEADNSGYFAFAMNTVGNFGSGANIALKVFGSTLNTMFGTLAYDTADLGSQVAIVISATDKYGLLVRSAAGQASDPFVVELSNGTDLFAVSAGGVATLSPTSATAPIVLSANGQDQLVTGLTVNKFYTSTGPAVLTMGAVTDGEYLKRSGTEIISAGVDLSAYVTTAGLTAGTVPKASDTHALADSLITESGAVVSIEGDLTLNADALGENRTLTIEGWDTGTSTAKALTFNMSTTGFPLITFSGNRWLCSAFSDSNTFLGYLAGNITLTGTGDQALQNTAVGRSSLTSLTTGYRNASIGYCALTACNTGHENVAIGNNAMGSVASGSINVGIGTNALLQSDGSENVGIGTNTGYNNKTGNNNVFIGSSAGFTNNWHENIFIGARSGNLNTGTQNVSIGCEAFQLAGNVSFNVCIGYRAGYAGIGAGSVCVGYQAGRYETASNKLFIDNAQRASEADARAKALIYGVFAAATADQHLYFNSNVYISNVLETNGVCLNTVTKTADYTLTTADDVVVANKATAITLTLPAATGSGRRYIIKSIGLGACTIDGDSADTIDGAATAVLSQYDAAQLIDYAANAWAIV